MVSRNESYEIRAIAFYRMTGKLAPGKDVPAALARDDLAERQALWEAWNERYGVAAEHVIVACGELFGSTL